MQTIIITNNEAGQRTDKFLRKLLPQTPLGEIYKMLRTKKIKINGKKLSRNTNCRSTISSIYTKK
ncbi:MAG: hypothetical protein ACI3ZR_10025 [bacterium]